MLLMAMLSKLLCQSTCDAGDGESQVKEALLIMTQHNMVRVTMPTEREMRRARANASGVANVRLQYTVRLALLF